MKATTDNNLSGKYIDKLSQKEKAYLMKKNNYIFTCNMSMVERIYVRMSDCNTADVVAYFILKKGYIECYSFVDRKTHKYTSLCRAINATDKIYRNTL